MVRRQRLATPRGILLYAERDIWKPYEKHHSTVKDACELAESWGSRTSCSGTRRTAMLPVGNGFNKSEGKRYYSGNIYVPDDESLIAL